jgi:hypothetical protein
MADISIVIQAKVAKVVYYAPEEYEKLLAKNNSRECMVCKT